MIPGNIILSTPIALTQLKGALGETAQQPTEPLYVDGTGVGLALLDQSLRILLSLTGLKYFALTFLWLWMIPDWVASDKRLDPSGVSDREPKCGMLCSLGRLHSNPSASLSS